MVDQSGRSKGCATAEFATALDAESAIAKLTDREIHGRKIFIREDREPPSAGRSAPPARSARGAPARYDDPVQGRQIFVGNLSFQTTWQELKDACRKYGDVERADVMQDRDGRSRGFGVVLFSTPGAANRAIQRMNNTDLDGRAVSVKLDELA
eukprot:c6524_g1_i2.p1 GENE.c6524_g1_i2~~c6524_g1_i2.p1  ORF type:complete len:153 (-),score=23.58 c6524_g1_i2:118-576(-)